MIAPRGTVRELDFTMNNRARAAEPSVLAGVAGGLIAGWTMNMFSRAAAAIGGGREAPGAAPGRDRFGRGAQPPQALSTADCDATVLVGSAVYRTVAGRAPNRDVQPWIGSATHYAFSAAVGAAYVLAVRRAPLLRRGRGLLYGAVVWSVADETVMPALGVSRGPRSLDPRVHAYALLAHLVYGATLDAVALRDGRW
jgi:uncharacterized membrane protein YagU involved in acid resistance